MKSFLAFLASLARAFFEAWAEDRREERAQREAIDRERRRVDDDAVADDRAQRDPNGVLLREMERQRRDDA